MVICHGCQHNLVNLAKRRDLFVVDGLEADPDPKDPDTFTLKMYLRLEFSLSNPFKLEKVDDIRCWLCGKSSASLPPTDKGLAQVSPV